MCVIHTHLVNWIDNFICDADSSDVFMRCREFIHLTAEWNTRRAPHEYFCTVVVVQRNNWLNKATHGRDICWNSTQAKFLTFYEIIKARIKTCDSVSETRFLCCRFQLKKIHIKGAALDLRILRGVSLLREVYIKSFVC
jgi:hypothetical protein